jgi:hypothetical protein
MNEINCKYVSSRGLLKSCDVYNREPQSSSRHIDNDYIDKIKDYDIVHICSWLTITIFMKTIVPYLTKKIIVVSNDSDMDAPIFEKYVGPGDEIAKEEICAFINSDLCIHWFTQNCTLYHPKVTPIPIGLDYHTVSSNGSLWGVPNNSPIEQENILNEIKKNALHFSDRINKCYGNCNFNIDNRYYSQERIDCINQVPSSVAFFESQQINRNQTWINQSKYTFVLSSAGGGIDCHRTWEALILGCIPIVRRFNIPHDNVYDDLPVLIIDKWSDITQELLNKTIEEFKTKSFNYDKLTLKYWTNLFQKYKYNCQPSLLKEEKEQNEKKSQEYKELKEIILNLSEQVNKLSKQIGGVKAFLV